MKSLGIIAEYNPFHNGHLYHLESSRKQTGIQPAICIMSGNFTQRGEAALWDKWTRAALAVKAGVDLVIELPVAFTLCSAQGFAAGGIRLLNSLGAVSHVCFGAETHDLIALQQIADRATHESTIALLKKYLQEGKSYAAAFSTALSYDCTTSADILRQPNNILSIEYLKAINQYHCHLAPVCIKRKSANYHDQYLSNNISSATAIRAALTKATPDLTALAKALPPTTQIAISAALREQNEFPQIACLDAAILATLRLTTAQKLAKISTISEGLENKLISAALRSTSTAELLTMIKSKRYPLSRLQRIIIHCLLGSPADLFDQFTAAGPLYARVLAFNKQGRSILTTLKKTSKIPLITKTTAYLSTASRQRDNLSLLQQMLAVDTYATDLYALCFAHKKLGAQDFTRSPIYIPQ